MQISSLETTQGLERKLSIDVEAVEIEQKIDTKLKELSRTLKLDGFRPGKIPLNVIRKRYEKNVRADVVEAAINETLTKALGEKSLRPASKPNIEITKDAEGENLAYTATFEIYPEISLEDVTSITVDKPVCAIDEKQIDELVENLKKMHADWNDVDRAAAEQDRLKVDIVTILDGEEIEEGSGKDQFMELADKVLMPELFEGLMGVKAGEVKEIAIQLPETHRVEKLAGQSVITRVTVNGVQERILPELDEAFVSKCGFGEMKVEEMREKLKENLETRVEETAKGAMKQALFEQLLEKHDVELPNSMIDAEQQEMAARAGKAADDELRAEAEKSVKLGLIIGQFVNELNLAYEQQELFDAVKEIAMGYKDPQAVAQNIFNNQNMLQRIIASILENKAVDKLLEDVQVNEINKSFEELMS